jgi:hypothetical protein
MCMLSRRSQEIRPPGNRDATLQMHELCQNLQAL